MKEFLAAALDFILCRITIFITGVRPPQELLNIGEGTKIYYANHASHGDFLLIFVSLPYRVRKRVRPVAAAKAPPAAVNALSARTFSSAIIS